MASSPELPPPTEVAPGLWSIAIPLVESPLLSVFTYALPHGGGVLLVDAGYVGEPCSSALEQGLAAAGRRVDDVTHVVLTHNHPDHIGLADAIRDASGAEVAVHRLDALADGQRPGAPVIEQIEVGLRLAGVPEPELGQMVESARSLSHHSQGLTADRLLEDGDRIVAGDLELEVVHTPGHTRGHICLLDRARRRLLSGDLMMPRGEVQLGIVALATDDPVGALERSLERAATLPVDRAFPGHQWPIDDVPALAATTAAAVRDAVEEAARQVEELGSCTAWELASHLTWPKPWDRMGMTARRFAVMQAIARMRRIAPERGWTIEAGPPERIVAAA